MSKYLKLYDNNAIIITRTGCHEHRNAPNRYKTVGLYENSLKLFIKEHQLIYFLFFNESPYLNKGISHLCNNKRCINISHLSLEPHSINTQRRSCQFVLDKNRRVQTKWVQYILVRRHLTLRLKSRPERFCLVSFNDAFNTIRLYKRQGQNIQKYKISF